MTKKQKKIPLEKLSEETKERVLKTIREDILNKEPFQQEILLTELSDEIDCKIGGLRRQLNKEIKLKKAGEIGKGIYNKGKQLENFIQQQPFLFDSNRLWFLWDNENYLWLKVDDVDILNMIEESTGADTTTPAEKNKIVNQLKQEGRRNFKNINENKPTWIQFKDTIIDLETGERFKASPDYFICNPIPWKIGESEATPVLDKLFKEWVITEGLQDESYVKTLQELMAYCIVPCSFLQRIIALVGHGANGKSTFQSVIEKFVGAENVCSTEMDMLKERFESSNLYKKLVVFVGEVDKSLFKKTGTIKRLSGEDVMRVEFKRADLFDTKLYCTPIISCNKLPETTDTTLGFFRRWLIVDFFNTFKKQQNIIKTIPDVEFENFALKSIKILQDLYVNGAFTNEGSFEEREKKYKEHSNPLDSFIADKCLYDDDSYIPFSDFYSDYTDWLKSNQFRIQTKRDVGISIKKNIRIIKKQKKINKSDGEQTTTRIIEGLKWKEDDETLEGEVSEVS